MNDTEAQETRGPGPSGARESIPAAKLLERVVELEGFFSPLAVPQVCFLELARRVEFVHARGSTSPARVAFILR